MSYYEDYWSRGDWDPSIGLSRDVRRLLEKHVPSGAVCLDYGCGDGGRYGTWLSSRVSSYVGMDLSRTAASRAVARGLDARVVDPEAPVPVSADTFDVVVCLETFEHLFAPQQVAAELLRVLGHGGRLIATVPNAAYWARRWELLVHGVFHPYGDNLSLEQPWRDPHIRFFTARSFERMLRSVGFEHVRVEGHNDYSATAEIPPHAVFGRIARGRPSGPVHRSLTRWRPSLFAQRLAAVAVKL